MSPSMLLHLATLGAPPPRGFGEDVEAGEHHVVGSGVILRKAPSAMAENIGTMKNGESVYAFGDTMLDDDHMIGQGGAAVPNDGTSPGIEYVRVGTQTHGPGWIAINFLTPGTAVDVPKPKPQPQPQPTTPSSSKPAPTTKDKVTTVLIGGLIGVAVLGGIVLLVKNTQSPRRLAHA